MPICLVRVRWIYVIDEDRTTRLELFVRLVGFHGNQIGQVKRVLQLFQFNMDFAFDFQFLLDAKHDARLLIVHDGLIVCDL
jgi:hypothetical protein